MNDEIEKKYDFCVVGGGIVGCAILRELSLSGSTCVLIEKEEELIHEASAKNSGICHSGYDNDCKTTPIENRCIRRGYKELLKLHHYSKLPLKKTGALLCAWTREEFEKLPEILELAYSNEVFSAKMITKEEALKMEPNLNPKVFGCIEIPDEFIVDPWVTPMVYALQALENGSRILRNSKVIGIKKDGQFWSVEFQKKGSSNTQKIQSKYIINCAGLYGDDIEKFFKKSTFTMRPRKGQFLVLKNSKNFERIILPVWNDRTKGVLIASTINGDTLIGPTAEEQLSRTEAKVEKDTLEMLLSKGKDICPKLDGRFMDSYAGLRPATEHKDYQLKFDLKNKWITVGGIRSTGLSSALGISLEVSETLKLRRIKSEKQIVDEASNLIEHILTSVENDVLVFKGEKYKVTHPISKKFVTSKF